MAAGDSHLIVLGLLGIVVAIGIIAAWIIVSLTGRYPRPLFDLVVGYNR